MLVGRGKLYLKFFLEKTKTKMLFIIDKIHNHQNNPIYAMNKDDIPLNKLIASKGQKPTPIIFWVGVTSSHGMTPRYEKESLLGIHLQSTKLKYMQFTSTY